MGRTPLNTKTTHLLWVLALSSALLLPACGKNEVKSEKIPETNLKSSTMPPPPKVVMTATAMVSPTQTATTNAAVPPITTGVNSYTKKKISYKHNTVNHAVVMAKRSVPMMAAPLATPIPTMASFSSASSASTPMATFTPVTAQAPKKPGSRWPLIVAGIALVAAVGFYFWTKKSPPNNDFPLPPMGGLSPVSGFTAMRKKVQSETKKQSIWTKKLF